MDSPGGGKATWGFIAAPPPRSITDGSIWIGGSSLVKIWRLGILGFGGGVGGYEGTEMD